MRNIFENFPSHGNTNTQTQAEQADGHTIRYSESSPGELNVITHLFMHLYINARVSMFYHFSFFLSCSEVRAVANYNVDKTECKIKLFEPWS